MSRFVHLRHKTPLELARPRELILACPGLKSSVNLSRIVRMAACSGIQQIIVCGNTKVDPKIARDGAEQLTINYRRTMAPVLKKLKIDGYRLVGLEQTTESSNLHHFQFERRTALVIGHERHGLSQEILDLLDDVVEIPVYGLPFSYNVATATTICLYEYCKQFPDG